MSFATKLKYAGSSPYEPEDERLPYPVFEALSQDETYQRLAEVRWLADELEQKLAGNTDVPEDTRAHIFRAVADRDAPLQEMVDVYVADWLAGNAWKLVEDWGIDETVVSKACDEFDVALQEVAET